MLQVLGDFSSIFWNQIFPNISFWEVLMKNKYYHIKMFSFSYFLPLYLRKRNSLKAWNGKVSHIGEKRVCLTLYGMLCQIWHIVVGRILMAIQSKLESCVRLKCSLWSPLMTCQFTAGSVEYKLSYRSIAIRHSSILLSLKKSENFS